MKRNDEKPKDQIVKAPTKKKVDPWPAMPTLIAAVVAVFGLACITGAYRAVQLALDHASHTLDVAGVTVAAAREVTTQAVERSALVDHQLDDCQAKVLLLQTLSAQQVEVPSDHLRLELEPKLKRR